MIALPPELESLVGGRPGRRVIFETALTATDPFSAGELVRKCRYSTPPASKATVYRLLRILVEKQFLREISLRGGHRVYLPVKDERKAFLVCDSCSRVSCFSAKEAIHSLEAEARQNGFPSGVSHLEVHYSCEEMARTGKCASQCGSHNDR